ncbi:hypothetical protein KFK09_003663 [Dendrobium nobile]|uniref:Uncharacterized protein n=1 Tax=Dendrobium nobile TaxID=94219 RepID=A0A8T3C3N2_DENNO|nr:hypothetical protein KFK09_003663 [Dendrobium nobile]
MIKTFVVHVTFEFGFDVKVLCNLIWFRLFAPSSFYSNKSTSPSSFFVQVLGFSIQISAASRRLPRLGEKPRGNLPLDAT